eukprot:GFUD01026106.1.p1 GENE.GFUD01026106.1~~GFUD01026106.1.p1  ORF type:complete len:291 (-),score=77.73 GFUD01026106.1:146-1018(-)
MVPRSIYLVVFINAGLFSTANSIKCYRNMTGETESCTTTGEIADTVQSGIASFWKTIKDGVQDLSGKDWIDQFGQTIADATGVDITSHEKNKAWVQNTMKKIGADFDVSGNCYVTYDKATKDTVERGCGAVGAAGTLGAGVVKWMQGKSFNFWANSVCFTVPGHIDQEVCMCSKEGCNKDATTARAEAGISPSARSAICDGKECPMAALSKIDSKYDFNSACYTGGEDAIVKCFTTDVLYVPEAAALTRSELTTDDGYKLFNIDGVDNSGETKKGMFAVLLGIALAVIQF